MPLQVAHFTPKSSLARGLSLDSSIEKVLIEEK